MSDRDGAAPPWRFSSVVVIVIEVISEETGIAEIFSRQMPVKEPWWLGLACPGLVWFGLV